MKDGADPVDVWAPFDEDPNAAGQEMYELAEELFPICRSITGEGVRQTLGLIAKRLPGLRIVEVPSGTRCFDWEVPLEWNIRDAYVMDESGRRVIDFRKHNLHVVGYSPPVDTTLSLEELEPHLFSLPELPTAIPYVTAYYRPFWGFCLSHQERVRLTRQTYRVRIDSSLKPGHLTYGEIIVPGERPEEVLLSTYVCHPSMANNELSGPVLATYLARALLRARLRFTYRILFLPETIGALAYLSAHLETLRARVVAGYQITCVGDDRTYSFLPSRLGNTLADKVTRHVLNRTVPGHLIYPYLERGSDERQYCAPGIDLPVVSVMRSKYGTYPEYHTSLDDLDLISPRGLAGSYELYLRCLATLEANRTYQVTTVGEPQLGRRGLYPEIGTRESAAQVRDMLNVIAYCDGCHDLVDVAERLDRSVCTLMPLVGRLVRAGVLRACDAADSGDVAMIPGDRRS